MVYLLDSSSFRMLREKRRLRTHKAEAFCDSDKSTGWGRIILKSNFDEYFDLLEQLCEAYPTNEDGTENISLHNSMRCWKSYCLENARSFGMVYQMRIVIVDPDEMKVIDL